MGKVMGGFWDSVLVPVLRNFPWLRTELLELLTISLFAFMLVLISILVGRSFFTVFSEDQSPTEIPQNSAAWTVRKDAPWIRLYHWFYETYPRDICSYFWASIFLLIASILNTLSGLALLLFGISIFIFWLPLGIWYLFLAILGVIKILPQLFGGFMQTLFRNIISGGDYLLSISLTYQVLTGMVLLLVLILFFRSRAGKLTRLWIKAKKGRYCPRIRVI